MKEQTALILIKISEIIADSRAHSFKIMGYPYLETILVLHYHDCNQVFSFKPTTTSYDYESYFTVDHNNTDRVEQAGTFSKEWDAIEKQEPDNVVSNGI